MILNIFYLSPDFGTLPHTLETGETVWRLYTYICTFLLDTDTSYVSKGSWHSVCLYILYLPTVLNEGRYSTYR